MPIIIKDKATGKEYDAAGDVLRDNIGNEWHDAFLTGSGMNEDSSPAWSIRYTPKGKHLQDSFRLKPDKFSVVDTDCISKEIVIEVIEEVFEGIQ